MTIDAKVHSKDYLIYYSEGKLKNLLNERDKEEISIDFSLDLKIIKLAIKKIHKKRTSRKLSRAYKELKKRDEIRPESAAKRDKFILIRAIVKCGTMWPWAGDPKDLTSRHVVWWAGSTAKHKILAYGSLSNYRHSSEIASPAERPSWYPSRADTYIKLKEAIYQNILSPEWKNFPISRNGSIWELFSTCFNDGVERAPLLREKEVVDMLLRVDCIDHDREKGDIIFGSPLWVKPVFRPIPGVYYTGETVLLNPQSPFYPEHELHAIAEWDGNSWKKARWQLNYRRGGLKPDRDPTPPSSKTKPKLDNIVKLIDL